MASARQAALRDQANPYASRRVLKPGSLGSSAQTIARQVADAEFESMVNRYADGLVTNQEMYSYLENSLKSPYFTSKEKVDIEDRLRDFQVVVDGDRLEAIFKATQGPDQVQAAQNLANFWEQRSATLSPGTPAQSNALAKAAEWVQKAQSVQGSIDKQERKLLRSQELLKLSALPADSMDRLEEEYRSYIKLSQEAAADGEVVEANDYSRKANDIINKDVPNLAERLNKEQESQFKGDLLDKYRQIDNAYHDGQISPQEAALALRQIDQAALQAGFYDFSSRINEFADRLQLDIEKGVEQGDIEGLPYQRRRSGGGEVEVSIKDLKAQFALEDDLFTQEKINIAQDTNAANRVQRLAELYYYYINGSEEQDWIGLKNRIGYYQDWKRLVPEKANEYDNGMRDAQTKVLRNEQTLAEIAVQYDSLIGDNGVATIIQSLPDNMKFQPGMGSQKGVLIEYDDLGRPYERVIDLNRAQESYIDPATGQETIIPTRVGSDIIRVPGTQNQYVKVQKYFGPGNNPNDPLGSYPDVEYAQINGELYVVDSVSRELVRAADAAAQDETIGAWYQQNKAYEDQARARFQSYLQQNPTAQPLQVESLAQNLQPQIQEQPTGFVPPVDMQANPTPQFNNDVGVGFQGFNQSKPFDYGTDFSQYFSPQNDVKSSDLGITNFNPNQFTDQYTYTPTYDSGTGSYGSLPKSNNLYLASDYPKSNLPQQPDYLLPDLGLDINSVPGNLPSTSGNKTQTPNYQVSSPANDVNLSGQKKEEPGLVKRALNFLGNLF